MSVNRVNETYQHNIPPAVWLVAAAIYVVCPIDFDFIPVVGWIDDFIVAYIGIRKWREGLRKQEALKRKILQADGQLVSKAVGSLARTNIAVRGQGDPQ